MFFCPVNCTADGNMLVVDIISMIIYNYCKAEQNIVIHQWLTHELFVFGICEANNCSGSR